MYAYCWIPARRSGGSIPAGFSVGIEGGWMCFLKLLCSQASDTLGVGLGPVLNDFLGVCSHDVSIGTGAFPWLFTLKVILSCLVLFIGNVEYPNIYFACSTTSPAVSGVETIGSKQKQA